MIFAYASTYIKQDVEVKVTDQMVSSFNVTFARQIFQITCYN